MAIRQLTTACPNCFPPTIRKKKRGGSRIGDLGTAAEAVRFAIEEVPAIR